MRGFFHVDLFRVLCVQIEQPDGRLEEVAAVGCRYVPITDPRDGRRVIAIELLVDPKVPEPKTHYNCPTSRIECKILEPKRVRRVRPWKN